MIDGLRTSIAVHLKDLKKVDPYLRKLAPLSAVSLSCSNPKGKFDEALKIVHSVTSGLTSLKLRCVSRWSRAKAVCEGSRNRICDKTVVG